jgi:hypothetical protein
MPKKIRFFDVTDFKNGEFISGNENDFDLAESLLNRGATFTPKAASQLIYAKIDQLIKNNELDTVIATEFSKAALLQILMQEDCEGIRFTVCKRLNDNGNIEPEEESLVALGIDSKGVPIGKKSFKIGSGAQGPNEQGADLKGGADGMPIAKEKGNRVTARDINSEMGENTNAAFEKAFFKSYL